MKLYQNMLDNNQLKLTYNKIQYSLLSRFGLSLDQGIINVIRLTILTSHRRAKN